MGIGEGTNGQRIKEHSRMGPCHSRVSGLHSTTSDAATMAFRIDFQHLLASLFVDIDLNFNAASSTHRQNTLFLTVDSTTSCFDVILCCVHNIPEDRVFDL